MNTDLITLEEGDKHDKAVEAMRTHNISHIPITDSNGRVEGLLSEFDLLKSMVRRQKMDSGDVKGEKNKFADIPCQELMDPNPLSISDLSISIFDAIKMLRSRGCRQLVVVDQDDKSQAILTLKDIIDYIASFQSQEAVLVNLINVDSDGEKQAIHEKLENALQGSLGRILERPTELNLHVKQYEKDGKRHKYSVHAKLFSELGTTMVHGHGWELLNVVDEIVNNLTERIKKEKSKRRDRVRERWKDGDYQV
jgi:CBS domain-containing protein